MIIGKKNFHDIQFLNGKVLISFPNCKTIKSSFVIFILKVKDWSNKKSPKEVGTSTTGAVVMTLVTVSLMDVLLTQILFGWSYV